MYIRTHLHARASLFSLFFFFELFVERNQQSRNISCVRFSLEREIGAKRIARSETTVINEKTFPVSQFGLYETRYQRDIERARSCETRDIKL